MQIRHAVLVTAALAFACALPARAADPAARSPAPSAAPLTAESMWQLKRVGDPQVSPDGRIAVVPVTRYDVKENKASTDLYAIPTAGGDARQLTSDPSAESEPRFSPDGRWIAFAAKRADDKQAQLYVMPTDGGEARRITDWPTGVSAPKWFPDSKRLAFLSRVWKDAASREELAKRLKDRDESKMSAKTWDRAPIAYWDHLLDDREVHVYVTDRTGAAPISPTLAAGRPLNVRDAGAASYAISPDGEEIAFASDVDDTGIRSNLDVFTVPVAGGAAKDLTSGNEADDDTPDYSPDGRWLSYTKQSIPRFYGDTQRLVLVDRKSGMPRVLADGWDRSASGLAWAPDSSGLYGSIDDAAARRIHFFAVGGGTPRAITKAHDFTGLHVAGRPAVLVGLRQSFSEPPTLVRIDAKTGLATKLSTFNDELLNSIAMGPVESVTYRGANGAPIQMWVIKPPGFDPAKKYPLFLILHGGPHNGITDTWQWRWNAQVFAGWGYVAAWHNFHGSSGFGQAFADSINPNWIDLPYEDTIKAADWFRAQPWIDADRMVSGGGSYGGYLTTVLLGREHPFKALVAHAAVYNRYTQVGSDYGAEKARFYDYWENPTEFQHTSPHMYAANFRTPTLVVHGQQDLRVPVNHGIELFNTLQTKGVPSKLVYFPDENHWVLKPQNSLYWYSQVKDWMTKYAKP